MATSRKKSYEDIVSQTYRLMDTTDNDARRERIYRIGARYANNIENTKTFSKAEHAVDNIQPEDFYGNTYRKYKENFTKAKNRKFSRSTYMQGRVNG